MTLTIEQKIRRLNQQGMGWDAPINHLFLQLPLLKKLYLNNGLRLELTCPAVPEQYEVFKDDVQVGYLRLRHGIFSVTFPDVMGEDILNEYPNGDGIFEANERFKYMIKTLRLISKKIDC